MGKVISLFGRPGGPPPPRRQVEAIPTAGARASCARCGTLCQVAAARNASPDPRAIRLGKDPAHGLCSACAFTEWFFVLELRDGHRETLKPEHFRAKSVQDQLLKLMRGLGADLDPRDIDWSAVEANWNLPFVLPDGTKIDPNDGLQAAREKVRRMFGGGKTR